MSSTTFPELDELEAKIAAKQQSAQDFIAEAKAGGDVIDLTRVKSVQGSSSDKAAWFQQLNSELGDLATKAAPLRALLTMADDTDTDTGRKGRESGDGSRKNAGAKMTLGQQFAKSAVRTGGMGTKAELNYDLKAVMSRSAGWAPESLRDPGYVPFASAPLMVTDLFSVLPTGQAAVKYMEQTTRTNNAAERAESATYGEAAFVLTERTVTVQTIGVWLPVTDEELEDETEAAEMIDLELPLMIRQRLDAQMLVGDGNDPNIFGINNVSGIQTHAKGADPVFDAIFKAMTLIRFTGRSIPSAAVFHPNDWQDIRLTRTTDGIYILGSPIAPGPDQIFGIQAVQSDNQTPNTAVVGDFVNWARFRLRRDILVEKTNAHASQFINGQQAIRAGVRGTTVFKRPAAFCTVTGI